MIQQNSFIDRMLKNRRVIITCGTGGVGKTTISAALAMRSSMLGNRSVVITVDPAKRLATSLGLDSLGDHPHNLSERLASSLKNAGYNDELTSSFYAIVPDCRHTIEDFIESISTSPAITERLFNNPIFRMISDEFSGANEYMAIRRLSTLYDSSDYDSIILDTPPSGNALAFLNAPRLLSRFFEERLIRMLVKSTNRFVTAGMKKALFVMEKLTGSEFISDLFSLGSDLFEFQVGFMENLEKMNRMFSASDVGFVIVASPTSETTGQIENFTRHLREKKFNFDGVVLNRSMGYFNIEDRDRKTADNRPALLSALKLIESMQKREKLVINRIVDNVPELIRVPEMSRDIHSVEDLIHVAVALGSDGFVRV